MLCPGWGGTIKGPATSPLGLASARLVGVTEGGTVRAEQVGGGQNMHLGEPRPAYLLELAIACDLMTRLITDGLLLLC